MKPLMPAAALATLILSGLAVPAAAEPTSPAEPGPVAPAQEKPAVEKPAAGDTAAAAKSAPSADGAQQPGTPPPPPPPPAMPGETQAQRDKRYEDLLKKYEELLKRVEELEKKKPEPDPTPPPPPTPDPLPPLPPSRGGPGGSATLIPNISVIGNIIGRAGDTKAVSGRGRNHFEELEIAFQDAVAPKLRYDVFLSAEKEEDWTVGLEEGFFTYTGLAKGLNLRGGRIRTPIGKFNPLHPHIWPFITQPSAHRVLLGDHGLVSDGAVFEYLLPTRKFYAALEVGFWQTTSIHADHGHEEHEGEEEEEEEEEEHEELGFRGGQKRAYSARFHTSKELGRFGELELGLSRYWGKGEVHDVGERMMAINGLDITYRRYPAAFRRIMAQLEFLLHETSDIGGRTRRSPGAYLLGSYRWNRFWEAGARLDYTRFPYPVGGKEYGASLFLTRFLTEQTQFRLEYRWARDRELGAGNGIFFQVLFGSGPHNHILQ